MPSTYDLEQVIKKIPETQNTAISETPKNYEITNDDFMSSSKNFWKGHESGKYRSSHDSGIISGSYNNQAPTLDSLFALITFAIKTCIQNHATIEDRDISDFELQYKNLTLAQKLLSDKFQRSFKNNIDGDELFSYIHGMINFFINKNIRKEK